MGDIATLSAGEKDITKIVQAVRQVAERLMPAETTAESAAQSATQIIAGAGLTGGGTLAADRTLAVGAGTGITVNTDDVALTNMAQSTIKGRAAGAGTGAPTDLTAAQATAILDAFTSALKGLVPASGGGTANFLRADGSFAAPPSGAILQCLQTTYTANADLTTALPIDNSVPTSTEGTGVMSLAIIPSDNTNKVRVIVDLSGSTNNQMAALAIFRDSTCIHAKAWDIRATTQVQPCTATILDSPASASTVTYSVRVGTTGGTAMRLNGTTTGKLFDTAAACSLTLEEVAAS